MSADVTELRRQLADAQLELARYRANNARDVSAIENDRRELEKVRADLAKARAGLEYVTRRTAAFVRCTNDEIVSFVSQLRTTQGRQP